MWGVGSQSFIGFYLNQLVRYQETGLAVDLPRINRHIRTTMRIVSQVCRLFTQDKDRKPA